MRKINKVLVANRGEIAIRVFRACNELGMQTVAIYSKEDLDSFHRFKADESYLVGEGKKPIDAYLDIEDIIKIAKKANVDAIHPGYGFLSENIKFAEKCEEAGIKFIGPNTDHLDMFGDKVKAKEQAIKAGISVIPGSNGPVQSLEEVVAFGKTNEYPIIIKASLGGGGRGMRIVRTEKDVEEAYNRAKSEAKAAFGNDEVYVEKFVENPKHIEVQILGDEHGNIVHLFERDCSVQRRHQKVVEIAPSVSLSEALRLEICDAAIKLMKNVSYVNAGTVEFLVANGKYYFIEVNPRVQVEHTITEMITGIDIVQSQILIAEGHNLYSEEVNIPSQENIKTVGYAIQSRITTEDPLNQFMPDAGKIIAYRSGGGFGVRLDAGNAYQGAVILPYYDSLLVKLSTHALTFKQAAVKMVRNLKEFRIRGIKTNIPFLVNVVEHESFLSGEYNTSFIDTTPALFEFPESKDRGTKILNYIGNVTVNGFPGIEKQAKPNFETPKVPSFEEKVLSGTKQILDQQGPEGVISHIKSRNDVLITDTTFRDAHQSLLATRVRTYDMNKVAEATSQLLPDLFSLEMWGGATFDVAYRFLKEDPWVRLQKIRKKVPNVLLQMLLRASNAVGYKNYPDNVILELVKESAEAGIDVFRIFDSLNWIKGLEVAIDAVRQTGKIAEAAICYTGDISTSSKYNAAYYKSLAKELENQGAHILAIKDMAGLLKPESAYRLVSELKDTVNIPIHLHTHDTGGVGIYTYAKAVEAGVDIVDVALSSMSGFTSQPSFNSLYYALDGHKNKPKADANAIESLSHYWGSVRKYYKDFESGLNAPNTEVYEHEMPGGQYSNLQQQAKAVGLGDRWDDVKEMYQRVNAMFGDIVKVTPSSKVVGDMALFMVQNNLTEDLVLQNGMKIDFPDSVVELFQGFLGQPYGGFPEELSKVILKDREAISVRPGELLDSIDITKVQKELSEQIGRQASKQDTLAYILYPKVFLDYAKAADTFGDISVMNTPTFFYGMKLEEEIEIRFDKGKTLSVQLVSIGQPRPDGTRVIYFIINGQSREVVIKDESITSVSSAVKMKIDPSNDQHIGATMPGTVINVMVKEGDEVAQGDHLMITEAMKMETTVQAPFAGIVRSIYTRNGEAISPGDLLLEVQKK